METHEQFLRSWAVLSKTANQPQVARYGSETYVFVGGYPVKQVDFHVLSTRAIFGMTTPLSTEQWTYLNEAVKASCAGLNVGLKPDEEAQSVVGALKDFYGIQSTDFDPVKIFVKVKDLETKMNALKTEAA